MTPTKEPTGLTAEQLDGMACIECGIDARKAGPMVPAEPVDGRQTFKCEDGCLRKQGADAVMAAGRAFRETVEEFDRQWPAEVEGEGLKAAWLGWLNRDWAIERPLEFDLDDLAERIDQLELDLGYLKGLALEIVRALHGEP